jgi:hypothetical protein
VGTFGTLGATVATTFVAVGFTVRSTGTGWDFSADPATWDPKADVALGFTPPDAFALQVKGLGQANFTLAQARTVGTRPNGDVNSIVVSVFNGDLYLSLPYVADQPARFAMAGSLASPVDKGAFPYLVSEFFYGIPTPSASVPTSGSVSYTLGTNDALKIDFATGTVSGHIYVTRSSPGPTQMILHDVVLSQDRTRFAGKLAAADGSVAGEIDGLLLGPAADEVILRPIVPSTGNYAPVSFRIGRRLA